MKEAGKTIMAYELFGSEDSEGEGIAISFKYGNRRFSGIRKLNGCEYEISKDRGVVGDVEVFTKIISHTAKIKLL